MAFKNDSENDELISEINVTPMVDVMLVLLVIFMISAPLLFSGVNLNLPKTKSVEPFKLKKDQIVVSMDAKGVLFINEQQSNYNDLPDQLSQLMDEEWSNVVYVRADKVIEYGKVAYLVSFLKQSGVGHLSLVTEIEP